MSRNFLVSSGYQECSDGSSLVRERLIPTRSDTASGVAHSRIVLLGSSLMENYLKLLPAVAKRGGGGVPESEELPAATQWQRQPSQRQPNGRGNPPRGNPMAMAAAIGFPLGVGRVR